MDTTHIKDWHAHVYFDPATRDAAWALRERIEKSFDIQMGRFHEKPVGPHPRFSYQVHFRNDQLAPILSWLTLNHGDLTVFVHPNTTDALRERIEKSFDIQMGRFHEKPVGPHPRFSYQVHFQNQQLAPLLAWLALNRGELTVFVHPNTGEDLEDHRDRAMWLGESVALELDVLKKKD